MRLKLNVGGWWRSRGYKSRAPFGLKGKEGERKIILRSIKLSAI